MFETADAFSRTVMERVNNRLRNAYVPELGRSFTDTHTVYFMWGRPIDVNYDCRFTGAYGVSLHRVTLSWFFVDQNGHALPDEHLDVVAPWLVNVDAFLDRRTGERDATDMVVAHIVSTLATIIAHTDPTTPVDIDTSGDVHCAGIKRS